ncbi:hypothetical protein P280DRAFT_551940 [Massarina eburnea CBS 473.64]|uniref:Uncharacterized protein n=1 Tax=Massarina eburnea CBS 473.64 TaxID=1395130 RepID=A0A6A6RRF1_9PLEO|nr:hypothetical protein P280DRAFT_551940 [Massarina eburnea CBS 473.64]
MSRDMFAHSTYWPYYGPPSPTFPPPHPTNMAPPSQNPHNPANLALYSTASVRPQESYVRTKPYPYRTDTQRRGRVSPVGEPVRRSNFVPSRHSAAESAPRVERYDGDRQRFVGTGMEFRGRVAHAGGPVRRSRFVTYNADAARNGDLASAPRPADYVSTYQRSFREISDLRRSGHVAPTGGPVKHSKFVTHNNVTHNSDIHDSYAASAPRPANYISTYQRSFRENPDPRRSGHVSPTGEPDKHSKFVTHNNVAYNSDAASAPRPANYISTYQRSFRENPDPRRSGHVSPTGEPDKHSKFVTHNNVAYNSDAASAPRPASYISTYRRSFKENSDTKRRDYIPSAHAPVFKRSNFTMHSAASNSQLGPAEIQYPTLMAAPKRRAGMPPAGSPTSKRFKPEVQYPTLMAGAKRRADIPPEDSPTFKRFKPEAQQPTPMAGAKRRANIPPDGSPTSKRFRSEYTNTSQDTISREQSIERATKHTPSMEEAANTLLAVKRTFDPTQIPADQIIEISSGEDSDSETSSSSSEDDDDERGNKATEPSTSPEVFPATETGNWYQRTWPPHETGILPSDSLQDIIINSIEQDDESTLDPEVADVGARQYRRLIHEVQYTNIEHDFTSYSQVRPCNLSNSAGPPPQPFHIDMTRGPHLSPLSRTISTTTAPQLNPLYRDPIYTSKTLNPLLPLAIIHLAQKNLPHLTFQSALENMPIGFHNPFPSWPYPHEFRGVEFLEDFYPGVAAYDMPEEVVVAFLPHCYGDGRHGVGFYTEVVGGVEVRRSNMVFTPCSVADLVAAKLVRVKSGAAGGGAANGAAGGLGNSATVEEKVLARDYRGLEIGARGGYWLAVGWRPWTSERRMALEWRRRVESFACVIDMEE